VSEARDGVQNIAIFNCKEIVSSEKIRIVRIIAAQINENARIKLQKPRVSFSFGKNLPENFFFPGKEPIPKSCSL
jgi:hypothetical protein